MRILKAVLMVYVFGVNFFVHSSNTNKDITAIIAEDYALTDNFFGDNIFLESANSDFTSVFQVICIDTIAAEFFETINFNLLRIDVILKVPIIQNGKLVTRNDTLSYFVLGVQQRCYKLFGFLLTDILSLTKKISPEFLNCLSKSLVINKILNNGQAKAWKKSVLCGRVIPSKVDKPCELLRLYGDSIENFRKTSLIEQYQSPFTL